MEQTAHKTKASQMNSHNAEEAPVAIIGFGTAGYNAALALRVAGYAGDIQVFSDTKTLPYSPILTSYYAGGEKTYEECFPWSEEEIADLDLEVFFDTPVVSLDVQGNMIRTGKGAYPFSKCVIATGATPVANGFVKDCDYEPFMLRTMEDAQALKDHLEDPSHKRFLVSGASMVALKMLEAALNHEKEVTLVGMNPHVLDFNAVPEAAERFEKGLRHKGVTLRLGQTIVQVKRIPKEGASAQKAGEHEEVQEYKKNASDGDLDDYALEVTFSDGSSDIFDGIALAHGMKCNLDFVEPGALAIDKALVVDDFMRTSDPDIYAAGDVAQAYELISGEKRIVGIWKCAAKQGQVAGRAIAAELAFQVPDTKKAYQGAIPTNTIAVNGTLFISAGTVLPEPGHEGELESEVQTTDDMTVVRVYKGEGKNRKLVGFNIVCDYDQEGSPAYDLGAMLTLRIEREHARQ